MKPITDFIILLLVMFCNALINSEVDDLPIVDTNLGRIQGRNLRSRLDNSFLAFRGIRYAEAPVNDLRFQVNESHFIEGELMIQWISQMCDSSKRYK